MILRIIDAWPAKIKILQKTGNQKVLRNQKNRVVPTRWRSTSRMWSEERLRCWKLNWKNLNWRFKEMFGWCQNWSLFKEEKWKRKEERGRDSNHTYGLPQSFQALPNFLQSPSLFHDKYNWNYLLLCKQVVNHILKMKNSVNVGFCDHTLKNKSTKFMILFF